MLNAKPFATRVTVSAVVLVAAIALAAACGGDDDGGGSVQGGLCDELATGSYAYSVQAVEEVRAVEGTPVPSVAPGPPPYMLSWTVEGKVEHGTELEAITTTTDGFNTGTNQVIDLEGGHGWLKLGDAEWQESDTSVRPIAVRYRPNPLCVAFEPDLQVNVLQAEDSESVNGIASERYTVQLTSGMFFARSVDFGPASDAAHNITNVDATAWVADDGGFLSKLDLTGTGRYEDGRPMTVRIVFEVTDVDDSIEVKAPR